MKYILTFLLLLGVAYGAESYNNGSSARAESETRSQVVYSDAFLMTTGTDDYHTQAFFIGDMNLTDGVIQVTVVDTAGATEDINVLLHYSADRETWIAGTVDNNVLDAATAGSVTDTLGIHNGSDELLFHGYNWVKLEFDGQTGNPNGCSVSFKLILNKEGVDNPAFASHQYGRVEKSKE